MGNSGSFTEKAIINPNLFVFTKWNTSEVNEFLIRGQQELSETFALRKHEFEFLIGGELVDFNTSRALFNEVFDLDGNGLVDKFEAMCVICLTSMISNQEKIYFFFDLFNFNSKGYLYDSELTLLLLAITRGVFKVDQKYIPPNNKVITSLVLEAKLHAKADKRSIRKPELVKFALGNKDVLSFLESWRGHASQVLLGEEEQWRDLTFPCSQVSITPTLEWLNLGFPPASFIRWKRRKTAGSGVGYLHIFTHETSFYKTIDRRIIYRGQGILGTGTLCQGLLANRWLLNALAAMMAKPDSILSCISYTGQEDVGRFCTRFYEGAGWRSVNIDDRIPCTLDGNPIFCSSSHSLEAFPMILEKGLAKYLGSYGHLGLCARRGDSTEAALRLLTGSHVEKYYVKDFEWSSVEDEIISKDPQQAIAKGGSFVRNKFLEGSLVSFGRSEGMSFMDTRISASLIASKRIFPPHPPHGRLFPYLGNVYKEGYNYLILRDAYDLINDCDLNVNFETGHCRTFQIKIEDIPFMFDTIMLGRFPDSLRNKFKKLNIKPWRTNVLVQDTQNLENPAKFIIKVSKTNMNDIKLNPIRKMGNRAINITNVLNESDGKVISELDKLLTLKEKIDFSRVKLDKDSYSNAMKNNNKSINKKEEDINNNEEIEDNNDDNSSVMNPIKLLRELNNKDKNEELVDIAFTISSSLDWSQAGLEDVGAKLRILIRPSIETFIELQEKDFQNDEIKRKAMEYEEATRIATLKLEYELAAQANAEAIESNEPKSQLDQIIMNDINSDNNTNKESSNLSIDQMEELEEQQSLASSIALSKHSAVISEALSSNKENISRRKSRDEYDIIFTAERSWFSKSILLYPGEYYIFADVAYDLSYEVAFKRSIPVHISEAPWLDAKSPINPLNNNIQQFNASRSSIYTSKKTIIQSTSNNTIEGKSNIAAPLDTTEANNRFGGDKSRDLSKYPQIYLQISSLEYYEAKPVTHKDLPLGIYKSLSSIATTSIATTSIAKETWPFHTETQSEASSRTLINMLTSLKSESILSGVQLIRTTNQFKDYSKQRILQAINNNK